MPYHLLIPTDHEIHDGIILSNRDKRTLLDKMVAQLNVIDIKKPDYFVADAYDSDHKMVTGLLDKGNH